MLKRPNILWIVVLAFLFLYIGFLIYSPYSFEQVDPRLQEVHFAQMPYILHSHIQEQQKHLFAILSEVLHLNHIDFDFIGESLLYHQRFQTCFVSWNDTISICVDTKHRSLLIHLSETLENKIDKNILEHGASLRQMVDTSHLIFGSNSLFRFPMIDIYLVDGFMIKTLDAIDTYLCEQFGRNWKHLPIAPNPNMSVFVHNRQTKFFYQSICNSFRLASIAWL